MIDPFHLEAYGETTVNYNRDVEVFPVLNTIFEKDLRKKPIQISDRHGVGSYFSATASATMKLAAKLLPSQEIIRRYYAALNDLF